MRGIQRYSLQGSITTDHDGDLVEYKDHLATMKELEKRIMRFAEWFNMYQWESEWEYRYPNFKSTKKAFQYWETNIDK